MQMVQLLDQTAPATAGGDLTPVTWSVCGTAYEDLPDAGAEVCAELGIDTMAALPRSPFPGAVPEPAEYASCHCRRCRPLT